jgi:hypothetical protein
MLTAWSLAVFTTTLETYYCMPRERKSLQQPSVVFIASMFLVAILTSGGCRYWLSRMRDTGWALIPFLLGLIFTWFTAMYGVFVLPEFLVLFQVMALAFFVLYFPAFVR